MYGAVKKDQERGRSSEQVSGNKLNLMLSSRYVHSVGFRKQGARDGGRVRASHQGIVGSDPGLVESHLEPYRIICYSQIMLFI